MWYLDDSFELLAFVVVLWSWKISGARANLERRNKLTRAEKPSEVIRGGVWRYKGASKRWGLREQAMGRLGGWDAYLVREDGARAKKCQEQLVRFGHGL